MQVMPQIIYEDEALLILDKPWGVTVNKSQTTLPGETLQDWIEQYLKVPRVPQASTTRDTRGTFDTHDAFLSRVGIVHRLDKETSGVIVVAKTEQAFIELQRQFKQRMVKKQYVALAHGKIEPEEGSISVPIGRLPWNRTHFGVVAGGREALTTYKVVRNKYRGEESKKEVLSLVDLYPHTGRTHQIRVHLKHIGHPIVSDDLYAGRKTARNDRKNLNRLFLHAKQIQFFHPTTGKEVVFFCPLPQSLDSYLQSLA